MRNRVRRGLLHPKHPNVWAVGHPELTEGGRVLAAVLAYPDGACLGGLSAAAHLHCHSRAPKCPVVLANTGTRRPGTQLIRGTARKEERRRIDGVPVTSIGRTLTDIARTAPAFLEPILHEGQVKGLLTKREHRIALDASCGRKGGKRLRALLAEIDPSITVVSELERLFVETRRKSPLPFPQMNVLLELDEERLRPDAFWPDHKLVVELDSRIHDTPTARRRDAHKDKLYRRAGLTPLRFRKPEVVDGRAETILVSFLA